MVIDGTSRGESRYLRVPCETLPDKYDRHSLAVVVGVIMVSRYAARVVVTCLVIFAGLGRVGRDGHTISVLSAVL